MTFETLLNLPPEGLEALSDEELKTYLTPYLATTALPENHRTYAKAKEKPEKKPKFPKPKTESMKDELERLGLLD